jgi:hypothetical protein
VARRFASEAAARRGGLALPLLSGLRWEANMRVRSNLVALLMLVTVGCGATGQGGDPTVSGSQQDPLAAAGVVTTAAALPAPKSYDVGAGPDWSVATAYSCLQACALLFGGTSADWACSTSATEINRFAWYSKSGTSEACGPTGTPLPEDYNPGGTYEAAGASAYVNDWCFVGEGSINYCHAPPVVVPPPPPPSPQPGGDEADECDDRECGSSQDEPDTIHGHDRRPHSPPGRDDHHRVRPAPAHAGRH